MKYVKYLPSEKVILEFTHLKFINYQSQNTIFNRYLSNIIDLDNKFTFLKNLQALYS